MPTLPPSDDSLLVRTSFADDGAWELLTGALAAENAGGFRAYVEVISDLEWAGATPDDVLAAIRASETEAAVAFVVDAHALTEGFAILVLDLSEDPGAPFRCVAAQLWSVDNNLNTANMDWEEFVDAVDAYGVFRGFH